MANGYFTTAGKGSKGLCGYAGYPCIEEGGVARFIKPRFSREIQP
jgi:hypothetical protein